MRAKRAGPCRAGGLDRRDLAWGLGILAAALVLRLGYIRFYRFDSDEPQHLHVIWGWAHGLVQYRDVFDNHAPLFHLLLAPLVRGLGDRPDLLLWMRLAMVPLFLLTLWVTYRIGRRLFSARVGWWAAIVTGLFVPFFAGSVELRADDLWALLWVAVVDLWVTGPLSPLRAGLAGLLLGAAFAVSLKTTALVAAAALGYLAAWLASPRSRRPGLGAPLPWGSVGALAAGCAAVPALVVGWFWRLGALPDMYYGVIAHNLVGGMDGAGLPWRPWAFAPTVVAITLWMKRRLRIRGEQDRRALPRAFVTLSAWIYVILILTLWPLVTQQDFLPVWPLLILPLAGRLDRPAAVPGLRRRVPGLLAVLAAAELLWVGAYPPWEDRTAHRRAAWQAVLDLTGPDELVMDRKGELVFRQRATYWVFERITRTRVDRGTIRPDIPADLVGQRVLVADNDLHGLPKRARTFIRRNYMPVGPLRVAGLELPAPRGPAGEVRFRVEIPARYRVVTPGGEAGGWLDGAAYTGARYLDAGWHRFRPDRSAARWVVVWARAVDRGYGPFRASPGQATVAGSP